jgi:hypothetical protein
MNAHIQPIPAPHRPHSQMYDRVRDDMPSELFDPPELFDPDEDLEELTTYLHIADTWND